MFRSNHEYMRLAIRFFDLRRLVVISCLFCAGCAGTRDDASDSDAVKGDPIRSAVARAAAPADLVREFYAWYVPIANGPSAVPTWFAAMSRNPAVLDTQLLAALRADSTAQSHAEGEIAGLDWDPFLATQDPCERYDVGSATGEGDTRLIPVQGNCTGTEKSGPDVIVEARRNGSSWLLINFRYPKQDSDLVSALRELHREVR
jgi:hypothetical protein